MGKVAYNEWGTELLNFLNNAVQHGDAAAREVAAIIFGSLFRLQSQVSQHFNSFIVIMSTLLDEPNPRVLNATCTAVAELALMAQKKDHVNKFRELIQKMIGITQRLTQSYTPDKFDSLKTLLSLLANLDGALSGNLGLVGPAEVASIIRVSLACASLPLAADEPFSQSIQSTALEVASIYAESRPKILTKEKLQGPLIQMLLQIAALPVEMGADDDANIAAAQSMDRIAKSGSPRAIFKELTSRAGPWLLSSDCFKLRGALTLVCIVSEGCAEPMKRHCKQLAQSALIALRNENHFVRMTAAFAIAQFSEFLSPEFTRLHSIVIPELINQIRLIVQHFTQEPSELLVLELNRCMYALAQIVSGLSNVEVKMYLGDGHSNLAQLAYQILSLENQSVDVMSTGFILVSSLAKNAGEHLQSLSLLPLCTAFVSKEPESILEHFKKVNLTPSAGVEMVDVLALIGHSITAIGSVVACAPVACRPHLDDLIKNVFIACKRYENEPDIMQCNFSFFQNVMTAYKEEFPVGAILPLVEILLKSLSPESMARAFQIIDETGTLTGPGISAPSGEDEEEEDAYGNNQVFSEAISALACIQRLYLSLPNIVLPLSERIIHCVSDLVNSVEESVVEAAVETLSSIVHGFHKAEGLVEFDRKTCVPVEVTETFMNIFGLALIHMYNVAATATTHVVVSTALDCMEAIIYLVGPAAVAHNQILREDIFTLIQSVLKFSHPCQQNTAEDDLDDDEESSANERLLFDSICAVTTALTRADRNLYETKIAKSVIPQKYISFASNTKNATLRGVGISFFGDLIPALNQNQAVEYINKIAPICLANLAEREDVTLLSDACFTLGVCVEVGGSLLFSDRAVIEKALTSVYAILTLGLNETGNDNVDDESVTADELHARDNAIACLARIVLALPHTSLPLEALLPRVFGALPLREDTRESFTVLQMFRHLTMTCADKIAPHTHIIGPLILKEFFQPQCEMTPSQLQSVAPFVVEIIGSLMRQGLMTRESVEVIMNNGAGENEKFTPSLMSDFRKALGFE
eukprot:GDKJ01000949.1.p1 GENE.GDKJ01000949.1~~GDKJ01000949.1.p1  ORF type:complete len:1150 (-),score=327.39 GDKJ01000949.1:148-3267(-)